MSDLANTGLATAIAERIAEEVRSPRFEVTQQYLRVLEIQTENGRIKIDQIEFQEARGQAVAYVAVKDESFFLAFDFAVSEDVELTFVHAAPFVSVSFMPTSKKLSLVEMLGMTAIEPSETIAKGEADDFKSVDSYNGVDFRVAGPGRFANKLDDMLDLLEQDPAGVKRLMKYTRCRHLFVTVVFHVGNTNFTGLWVEPKAMRRLAKLNLELTFDLYATGRPFGNEVDR